MTGRFRSRPQTLKHVYRYRPTNSLCHYFLRPGRISGDHLPLHGPCLFEETQPPNRCGSSGPWCASVCLAHSGMRIETRYGGVYLLQQNEFGEDDEATPASSWLWRNEIHQSNIFRRIGVEPGSIHTIIWQQCAVQIVYAIKIGVVEAPAAHKWTTMRAITCLHNKSWQILNRAGVGILFHAGWKLCGTVNMGCSLRLHQIAERIRGDKGVLELFLHHYCRITTRLINWWWWGLHRSIPTNYAPTARYPLGFHCSHNYKSKSWLQIILQSCHKAASTSNWLLLSVVNLGCSWYRRSAFSCLFSRPRPK